VDTFINSFKKGSKTTRKILSLENKVKNCKLASAAENFSRIVSVPTADILFRPDSFWLWSDSMLPNDFRDFLYKFYFNKLGVNDRISNFTDTQAHCTFCDIITNSLGPVPRETFVHLFINCPVVAHVHEQIDGVLELDQENSKLHWLGLRYKDGTYC
jgi:hypothetical protein